MSLNLYAPSIYRYVTDPSQYYDPANPTGNWKQRYYIGVGMGNEQDEAAANDISYADGNTNQKDNGEYLNPVHGLAGANGVKSDLSYTHLPFIIENTYQQDVYNVGFAFHNDPHSIEAKNGINFAPSSLQNQSANSSAEKLNAFDNNSIRMFLLGAINAVNYPIYHASLRNLQSSFWVDSRSGSLSLEIIGSAARAYLESAKAAQAINWWNSGGEQAQYDGPDLSFNLTYKIKRWSDGNRTDPHLTFVDGAFTSGDTVRIPANGAIWGYFLFSVTDNFNNAEEFRFGGENAKFIQHGNWSRGDLENAGFAKWILSPWNNVLTPCRAIRYGIHIAGRKAG